MLCQILAFQPKSSTFWYLETPQLHSGMTEISLTELALHNRRAIFCIPVSRMLETDFLIPVPVPECTKVIPAHA